MASIGVLRALHEMGVEFDVVAGTSMGALVGAFEAAGMVETLESIVSLMDWKKIIGFFTDVVFPRDGLIDGKKVEAFVKQYIRDRDIEDLPLPYAAVATDIESGEEVVLRGGKLIEAIRASISIPGIFTPVKREDRFLVDGALVNPVPVSVVREMGADVVIAVDVNRFIFEEEREDERVERKREGGRKDALIQLPGGRKLDLWRILEPLEERVKGIDFPLLEQIKRWKARRRGPNIFEIMINSTNIMGYHISRYQLEIHKPEVVITPRVGHVKLLEFHRAREVIEEGYRAAWEVEEEILKAARVRKRRK
ncbi:MAG: patatin [Deltaproteobacteria bacterium]|nr:MAG: patatin [Deltaproteobacteria bacterium]